jgi:F0F1-type ATP synthase delta subunit
VQSLTAHTVSTHKPETETIITVISAAILTEAEQALLQTKLTALSDSPPTFNFIVDDKLIAGIELHSRYLLIRNSWAADLEKIAQQLQPHAQANAEL